MKKEATIFDYARMCRKHKNCMECSLNSCKNGMGVGCVELIKKHSVKANEIILNWCKEHPVETRQDRFLKMFPSARRLTDGTLYICPKTVDGTLDVICSSRPCSGCCNDYWLAEVKEY